MITLSTDQEKAHSEVLVWLKSGSKGQYITLGGYAGTGKTTLIAYFRRVLHTEKPGYKVGFASYTGKAARVLLNKLREEKAIYKGDTVGTIHSLIYSPIVNEREEIVGWKKKDKLERDLIIIDEASMVDSVIWKHLISYNIPIIAVGDHGQLPPIGGSFNLMQVPQLTLEEIHRQARQNPIIGLSIQAREHGFIRPGRYGEGVIKYAKDDLDKNDRLEELLQNYSKETLILCGYNKTRKKLNNHIRQMQGFESIEPLEGDRVICLRNNHEADIYNGMLGTILSIEAHSSDWFFTRISMDLEARTYEGLISSEQFNSDTALNFTERRGKTMRGDLFDFGYALTVHKAQGSQASRVVLLEERFPKMTDDEWRRWLYTGVTRAESELFIF
jgi:exodeoxyribonuclease V